jgi:CRISPR/Cas system-associated exonuclease Cas4 (RecB family)
MPGIVGQADRYFKAVVNSHLQSKGLLPSWLADALNGSFSQLNFHSVQHIEPERWEIEIPNLPCILVGEADAVWEFPDGRWFIADYKMASWTQTQQRLLPLYETQLNAYAYLAQRKFSKTVVGLALIYFEPEHKIPDADLLLQRNIGQMMLGFRCTVIPVTLQPVELIESLCQQVLRILSSPVPPAGRQNCQGCQELRDWWGRVRSHLP